jgi:hypothetical protein
MKKAETSIMISVLKDELGFFWFYYLIKSILKKNNLLKETQWSHDTSTEGMFARRLSVLAALYNILQEKFNQGMAFRILSRIIVPAGCCEQWRNLRELNIEKEHGYTRLKVFYDFMGEGGSGQFVKRTLSSNTEKLVEYEVRECLFARFFKEMGMLELATLFCKVDRSFFPTAIADYRFSRGDCWKNSAAYGKDHCIFRFERIDDPVDEHYLKETRLLDYTNSMIQMLYEQLDLSYKSDEEKIGHFYEYVKCHIKTGDFGMKLKPASIVQKRGRGNDSDKSVLFMALLRTAGIPCRLHAIQRNNDSRPLIEVCLNKKWVPVQQWADGETGSKVVDSVWVNDDLTEQMSESKRDVTICSSPDDLYLNASGVD